MKLASRSLKRMVSKEATAADKGARASSFKMPLQERTMPVWGDFLYSNNLAFMHL